MNAPRRFAAARTLLPILALWPGLAAQAQEGKLAQLYAARPPAGSAFVRVIQPGPGALKVRVADGPEQSLGPAQRAGSYAIVEGGRAFAVDVAGQPRALLKVRPGSFTSLVADAPGRPLRAIDDSGSGGDALKAEVRFYNLATGCGPAALTLAGNGPALFADVAAGASAARPVNPVKAALSAGCGARTAAFALPALQPGDHYSLFLTGSAQAPQLQGQLSRTDPYTR